MTNVKFSENNSGGFFVLQPDHYTKLAINGWTISLNDRKANKDFESFEAGLIEFETVTGFDCDYTICNCCGQNFNLWD